MKNDIVEIEITDISSSGSGVGHCADGKAVFVPKTAVGDVIEVKIVKDNKSYCFGKMTRLITPSAERLPDSYDNPTCFDNACGGCDFRHLSYNAEIAAKEQFIKSAFRGLDVTLLPIHKSPLTDGYRNICRFPVVKTQSKTLFGFYREHSRDIIPVKACYAADSVISEIATEITALSDKLGISVYDPEKHEGVLRHICVRRVGEAVTATLVAKRKVPEFRKLATELKKTRPDINLILNVNPDQTNVIYGKKNYTLSGEPYLFAELGGRSVRVSHTSFFQVNTAVAAALYEYAVAQGNVSGKTVADLYGGVGCIGLYAIANGAVRLYSAEVSESACNDAEVNFGNAVMSDGSKLRSFSILNDTVSAALPEIGNADVVFTDAARKGYEDGVAEGIAGLAPERIIMGSCDLATAARDCIALGAYGYRVVSVKGFDMFPRTRHIEVVAVLERVSE
jgi:23S rRNA (uracil1939-C5)-methyltransferase